MAGLGQGFHPQLPTTAWSPDCCMVPSWPLPVAMHAVVWSTRLSQGRHPLTNIPMRTIPQGPPVLHWLRFKNAVRVGQTSEEGAVVAAPAMAQSHTSRELRFSKTFIRLEHSHHGHWVPHPQARVRRLAICVPSGGNRPQLTYSLALR